MEPIEAEVTHWVIYSEIQDVTGSDGTECWVKLACLSDYIRFPETPFNHGDIVKLTIEKVESHAQPRPTSVK